MHGDRPGQRTWRLVWPITDTTIRSPAGTPAGRTRASMAPSLLRRTASTEGRRSLPRRQDGGQAAQLHIACTHRRSWFCPPFCSVLTDAATACVAAEADAHPCQIGCLPEVWHAAAPGARAARLPQHGPNPRDHGTSRSSGTAPRLSARILPRLVRRHDDSRDLAIPLCLIERICLLCSVDALQEGPTGMPDLSCAYMV
jgi:hypothetical protein